jgi:hypothetical protein
LIVKDCGVPTDAAKLIPAVARAVSVHVPELAKRTTLPDTVHVVNVFDVTDGTPSPSYL